MNADDEQRLIRQAMAAGSCGCAALLLALGGLVWAVANELQAALDHLIVWLG